MVNVYAVEIWADAECTRRPSGLLGTVYAQINKIFEPFETAYYPGDGATVTVAAPSEEVPEDPYAMIMEITASRVAFVSTDYDTPLSGVVMLYAGGDSINFDNLPYSFGPLV